MIHMSLHPDVVYILPSISETLCTFYRAFLRRLYILPSISETSVHSTSPHTRNRISRNGLWDPIRQTGPIARRVTRARAVQPRSPCRAVVQHPHAPSTRSAWPWATPRPSTPRPQHPTRAHVT